MTLASFRGVPVGILIDLGTVGGSLFRWRYEGVINREEEGLSIGN